VIDGGELRQVFRRLPVRCLPKDIPVKVVHDITELELDHSVHASELAIPETSRCSSRPSRPSRPWPR